MASGTLEAVRIAMSFGESFANPVAAGGAATGVAPGSAKAVTEIAGAAMSSEPVPPKTLMKEKPKNWKSLNQNAAENRLPVKVLSAKSLQPVRFDLPNLIATSGTIHMHSLHCTPRHGVKKQLSHAQHSTSLLLSVKCSFTTYGPTDTDALHGFP